MIKYRLKRTNKNFKKKAKAENGNGYLNIARIADILFEIISKFLMSKNKES